MQSRYYFAVWTECGVLLGCQHKHKTVIEAVSCISHAGGYVVAVENGLRRALDDEEKKHFQHTPRSAPQPVMLEYGPSGYAIMTRVRVADEWIWTTWMRCETFEDAVARARAEDLVVRFGSARWNALLLSREPASPASEVTSAEAQVPRRQGESVVEYVSRIGASPPQSARRGTTASIPAEPISKEGPPRTFIELVLDWIDDWEERLAKKIHVLRVSMAMLLALRMRARKRFRRTPPRED
jgi:hypothetical protein